MAETLALGMLLQEVLGGGWHERTLVLKLLSIDHIRVKVTALFYVFDHLLLDGWHLIVVFEEFSSRRPG